MTARVRLPSELEGVPFSVAQGRGMSVGRRRMQGDDLSRPFHGIRQSTEPDSVRELCLAYLQRMPTGAVFCSVTAAMLLGVPLPRSLESDRRLHVAVPRPARAPRGRGIVGHSVDFGDGRIHRLGLPLTAPAHTWSDLGRVLALDDLVAAGDHLIHHRLPLATVAELSARVERMAGARGVARLREALPLLDERSESRRESLLRVLLVRGGIRGLRSNHWIELPGSRVRYRADFAIPELKIAIEYQSDYHRDPAQWRSDMTRISRLQAHGWLIIQVNHDDLLDPVELVSRVGLVIASRV